MSFLSTDTKGDVMRNYGGVAKEYGYNVSVIDLRNPTKSNGNNLLNLVNKYMDLYKENPNQLAYKAKAEKYAKIISKTIILSGAESASFGQNAYFYDAAEGILTATILLVAEFCESQKRHIVSVFKIIQELLAPSEKRNKNQFQELMALLPNDHKAKWFAGAALNASDQSMASVMSTALSRLNVSAIRKRTNSMFRYGNRRRKILFGKVRHIYHNARRSPDNLLYDFAYHSAVIPRDISGSR